VPRDVVQTIRPQPRPAAEVASLRAATTQRMEDAEDTLRAIGAGEIDAFVVSGNDDGEGNGNQVFTLVDADRPYRLFVENMPDGAATISAAGLILYANRRLCQLLAARRETIVGSSLASHVAGAVPPVLRRAGAGRGFHATVELEVVDSAGLVVPVLVGASPLQVEGDRLTCLTFTDLSDQKAHEKEIERLEEIQVARSREIREEYALNLAETQKLEALGVLAGGIAHDFNNLLTVILGNTSIALAALPAAATARAPLEQVELAAMRSTDLARQMLAYSGKGTFVIEVVSLPDTVTGLEALLRAAISKKAHLSVDFARETPTIEADATQLRQVILNLITNASDAIGDTNGSISVRSGQVDADRAYLSGYELAGELPEGSYAFLQVVDTGSGMDAATKDRIFDPFFTTKFTGRGLGLAAVQGIVRGHQGAMKVESRPGVGTTFTLIFPASGREVPVVPSTPTPPSGLASGTVLVVDDDDAVRGMAARMVASLGFEVVSAANGNEAVRVLSERPGAFAFVLLDLMMPGMGGDEVMLEMQRIGATTPVVLSSGYDAEQISRRFVGGIVAAVLQKPYEMDQLRAAAFDVVAARVG
jgi:PAS domain S-box-containing protein